MYLTHESYERNTCGNDNNTIDSKEFTKTTKIMKSKTLLSVKQHTCGETKRGFIKQTK